MACVEPKKDCPHCLEETLIAKDLVSSGFILTDPCHDCGSLQENWLCLACKHSFCSRYVKGHMSAHGTTSGHHLVLSFSDLSFWCYACDSYVIHPNLDPILDLAYRLKFGEERPKVCDQVARMAAQSAEEAKRKPKREVDYGTLSSLEDVARLIRDRKCQKVVALTGSGLPSGTSISDFLFPDPDHPIKTKVDQPPIGTFECRNFLENPAPLYTLAKQLMAKAKPNACHELVKLLSDKGALLRNYTQNIEGIEEVAGIPSEKIVYTHGNLRCGQCTTCNRGIAFDWTQQVPMACDTCGSIVRPNIKMLGEPTSQTFMSKFMDDCGECDMLIVFGHLNSNPITLLPRSVGTNIPRVLLRKAPNGAVADPIGAQKSDLVCQESPEDSAMMLAMLL